MQKECECIMFGKLKNLFSSSGIAVAAPVSGTVVPLSEVPDPTSVPEPLYSRARDELLPRRTVRST